MTNMTIQRTGGAAAHILGGGITLRSAGGGAATATYAAVLRDTYAASEIWPLVNIASGTTITAFISSARNGSETGWTLQSAAGPVTGTLAPLSGTGDFGNIYTTNGSTGLKEIWNGDEGSFFCWAQVSASGVWTDGTNDDIVIALADANNNFTIRKTTTSNQLQWFLDTGAAGSTTITSTYSDTGWFSVGMSWSKAASQVKAFLNGAQVGVTDTDAIAWAGVLSATRTLIGANATSATNPWNGYLAYPSYKFGSIWSVADFAAMHAAAATAGPDV